MVCSRSIHVETRAGGVDRRVRGRTRTWASVESGGGPASRAEPGHLFIAELLLHLTPMASPGNCPDTTSNHWV